MVQWWSKREEYSHGFLIPLITAYLVWQPSDRLCKLRFEGSWWEVALAAWAYVGTRTVQLLALPLLLLFFMLPLSNLIFKWARFVRSCADRDVVTTKCESMVGEPAAELGRVMLELTRHPRDANRVSRVAEKYLIQNQAKRAPRKENRNSFLCKEEPGHWKDACDGRAAYVFDEIAGRELPLLGYIADGEWVDECG